MLSGNEPRIFIHGFLGLPSDWQPFLRAERDVAVDLWSIVHGAAQATSGFQFAADKIVSLFSSEKPVLVGYSLGARLAMHALLRAPEKFSAAVLISGHPGLTSEDERRARVANDQRWAERFRHEEWNEVMAAWNKQAVLRAPSDAAGGLALLRPESEFTREALAKALDCWSLGRQRDLRNELAELDLPLLILTGSEDKKFTALNAEFVKNLGSLRVRHEVISGAGHRLPWEQPRSFVETAATFLQTAWTLG